MLMCNVWKSIKPWGRKFQACHLHVPKHESLTHSTNVINHTSFKPCTMARIKMKLGFWLSICMSHYYWTTTLTHLFYFSLVAWLSQHLNQWLLTRLCSLNLCHCRAWYGHPCPLPTHPWDGLRLWCKWAQGQVLVWNERCTSSYVLMSYLQVLVITVTTLWRHGQLLCTTCFDGYENLVWFYRYCLPDFSKTSPACRSKLPTQFRKKWWALHQLNPALL